MVLDLEGNAVQSLMAAIEKGEFLKGDFGVLLLVHS
jgi:hypothetical protein